jgi:hypothetical protein
MLVEAKPNMKQLLATLNEGKKGHCAFRANLGCIAILLSRLFGGAVYFIVRCSLFDIQYSILNYECPVTSVE